MRNFLVGLLILVLMFSVCGLLVALIQQGQSTQMAIQTAQTQADGFLWQQYNQALQTLYALVILICGGIISFVVLVLVGIITFRRNNRKQQGKWASGSYAYWGRVGGQPHRPQAYNNTYPPYIQQPVVYLPIPRQSQPRGYGETAVPYQPYPLQDDPNGLIDGLFFDEE